MHRLAKIARMTTVQRQMHRLAEWQLFDLMRREDRLREETRELITSLNDETSLHGLFVESMAKHLTAVGIEAGAVAKAREAQSERVLAEGRKLRHVERIHEATAVDVKRRSEKAVLDDVIEAALLRQPAGIDRPSGPADES
jgi:hypothetical protein